MATTSAPKLTLTYFNFTGRAEPLRLAAAIGKVSFFNRAIAPEDWQTVKPTLPLGQVPVLQVETSTGEMEVVAQSSAILRYLGTVGDRRLYPTDPIEAMKVDAAMSSVDDAAKRIEMTVQGSTTYLISEQSWSKDEVLAIRRRIARSESHGLPFFLSYFENMLSSNDSGWLVGKDITIADLQLYRLETWVGSSMLDGIPAATLDPFPLVRAHKERIESLPEVLSWRSKHPTPYTDFAFEP
jgi:prostaglandin-H2 D-isomerase / glutathione transferase